MEREQQQQQIALQNSRRTNWLYETIRCIEFFFLILECIILKRSQVKYIFFVECDNSNIFTVLQIPWIHLTTFCSTSVFYLFNLFKQWIAEVFIISLTQINFKNSGKSKISPLKHVRYHNYFILTSFILIKPVVYKPDHALCAFRRRSLSHTEDRHLNAMIAADGPETASRG